MTDVLNNSLLKAIREKIPEKANLANILMEILPLGKEAAYRRLRGEVPFTFFEVVAIARKLGISLDTVIGRESSNKALFDLNMVDSENAERSYSDIFDDYSHVFRSVTCTPGSVWAISSNVIPQAFYLKYELLSKFHFFKWLYQQEKVDMTKKLHELVMPPKLIEKQQEFVRESTRIESSLYIWDSQIVHNMIKELQYFIRINLIEEQDVQAIKKELLDMLAELENIAFRGRSQSGNQIQIYVSDINFEASYSYIEGANLCLSLIRVFSINSITSLDRGIFEITKNWIHTLKKFSTLISESGEVQRVQFFQQQRDVIHNNL